MNNHRMSFYTRKKFQHKFFQSNFQEPKTFIDFLNKHDIRISIEELEMYEKIGLIQPIFRLDVSNLEQNNIIQDSKYFKKCFTMGLVEFPKKGDYKPWTDFKLKNSKNHVRNDKKLIFFHPFQIIQIHEIQFTSVKTNLFEKHTKKNIHNMVTHLKSIRKIEIERIKNNKFIIDVVGMLMVLQEPYGSNIFGSLYTTMPMMNYTDSYYKWLYTRYSPAKFIRTYGISIPDIKQMCEFIARDGHMMDPVSSMYDLMRILKPSVINATRKNVLKSQYYYKLSKMFGHLYYDLTKIVLEPDHVFDASDGTWRDRRYSQPFDYRTRKTQKEIIEHHIYPITTRLYLIVEGDIEKIIIENIFEKLNIDKENDGIKIINAHGISNINTQKLNEIIDLANRDFIHVYIIADNENGSISKIKNIKDNLNTNLKYNIWDKSFEEDNFGKNNVIKIFNKKLNKHDQKIHLSEITSQQKNNAGLITAITNA